MDGTDRQLDHRYMSFGAGLETDVYCTRSHLHHVHSLLYMKYPHAPYVFQLGMYSSVQLWLLISELIMSSSRSVQCMSGIGK